MLLGLVSFSTTKGALSSLELALAQAYHIETESGCHMQFYTLQKLSLLRENIHGLFNLLRREHLTEEDVLKNKVC